MFNSLYLSRPWSACYEGDDDAEKAAAEKAAAAEKVARWATREEVAQRWATNDKWRRSLEGRLRGAAPQYAAPIERQLKEVKRLLRRDSWAVEK